MSAVNVKPLAITSASLMQHLPLMSAGMLHWPSESSRSHSPARFSCTKRNYPHVFQQVIADALYDSDDDEEAAWDAIIDEVRSEQPAPTLLADLSVVPGFALIDTGSLRARGTIGSVDYDRLRERLAVQGLQPRVVPPPQCDVGPLLWPTTSQRRNTHCHSGYL